MLVFFFFFSARGQVCSFLLFLVSKQLFLCRQCKVFMSEVIDTC